MLNFLFGVLAGMFLMLVLLQLSTKKTITMAGFTDKEKNQKEYWAYVLAYLGGFLSMVNLYLFIPRL